MVLPPTLQLYEKSLIDFYTQKGYDDQNLCLLRSFTKNPKDFFVFMETLEYEVDQYRQEHIKDFNEDDSGLRTARDVLLNHYVNRALREVQMPKNYISSKEHTDNNSSTDEPEFVQGISSIQDAMRSIIDDFSDKLSNQYIALTVFQKDNSSTPSTSSVITNYLRSKNVSETDLETLCTFTKTEDNLTYLVSTASLFEHSFEEIAQVMRENPTKWFERNYKNLYTNVLRDLEPDVKIHSSINPSSNGNKHKDPFA